MAVTGLGLALSLGVAGICLILAFGTGGEPKHPAVAVTKHGFSAKRGPGSAHEGARSKVTYHVSVGSSGGTDAAQVPRELYAIVGALIGALVGLLLPSPQLTWRSPPQRKRYETREGEPLAPVRIGGVAGLFALAGLVGLLLATLAAGDFDKSPQLQALAAGLGTAAIALLIPSPARFDLE